MRNGPAQYRSSKLSPKNPSKKQRIRTKALCVFRNGEKILVYERYDPAKGKRFYRPIGGGIDFGELSREAMVREVREELSADVTDVRFLGVLENVFTYVGRRGHEIVLMYDARFEDESFYEQPSLEAYEKSNDRHFEATWKSLAYFRSADSPPLYPNGLLELLSKKYGDAAPA